VLRGSFRLAKRFRLGADWRSEFQTDQIPDSGLTHSCATYIDDGSTVFSRDNKLVLKVASACGGGECLYSGRVMSKETFQYGLFVFVAKIPKCNYIWPALWLLPQSVQGDGAYGRWPCSGEIDVMETVHDQGFGAFNLVGGYGSDSGCDSPDRAECNRCLPGFCTSTTYGHYNMQGRYIVEPADCGRAHPTWQEHTFVLSWQPDELITWVNPHLSYDDNGHLVSVTPRAAPVGADGLPTWRSHVRQRTPTWQAVRPFMQRCFPGVAGPDAPFDKGFKIVMNIAIGGYDGAPCMWGRPECTTVCGGAVGSELVLSDMTIWRQG